jgi:replicative DNA helicase
MRRKDARRAGAPPGPPPDEPIEARLLPHNLEAERAILGAVLLHGEVIDRLVDVIAQGDFYRQGHAKIFAAMCRLADASKPIEMVTLRDELLRADEMDIAGGPAYLAALVDGMPRAVNVEHYAAIVLEKSRLRAAIAAAVRLTAKAHEGDKAVDIAADAAEALAAIGAEDEAGQAVRLGDLLTPGIEALEQAVARGQGAVTGLATGFSDLDDLTAGLQASDLVLIAARTSQGKTALAMNLVRNVGANVPVLVFSLEMSKHQLFMRMLAAEAKVDSHRLRTGYLTDRDWGRIAAALGALADLKVWIHDAGGISVREVRSRARQVKSKHGLGAIFVDYIQLMRGRGTFDNRTQEIGTISRGLKALAKELDVPVVALAQLNRASEGGFGKKARRPQLSDLAESGSLENDADMVWLIYRPERKDDDTQDPPAEIIVAKQRNGPTGTVRLAWNHEYVRFDNLRLPV